MVKLEDYRPSEEEKELLLRELKGAFDFFWDTANTNPGSKGFGLIPDRMPSKPEICSIASVGYGLAAICIGVERGFISRDEGYERTLGTLITLRDIPELFSGFFYHFVYMESGLRAYNCEVSVIDTCIAVNGALAAGEYFGGEIKELAKVLYERVDWTWYIDKETLIFHMGYLPESGFFHSWDMTAEQFMMYFMGAGSPTYPIDGESFYKFDRPVGKYGDIPETIHSPRGSLFVYLFSHMWFDLRGYKDRDGVDWFINTQNAVLANRQIAIDRAGEFGTGADSWGFSACDGPNGYTGDYGAPPSPGWRSDGTVATYAAAASLPFTPEYSIKTIEAQYKMPGLLGDWGLKDSYNKMSDELWMAKDTIGIDKGSALLMIENYLTGFIWKLINNIDAVRRGYERCGLERRD